MILSFTHSGILCRKGQFTKEETQNVHDTIQMYQKVCRHPRFIFGCLLISVQENDLDDERLDDMIYSAEPAKGFWSYIGHRLFGSCRLGLICVSARAVPPRGVKSVFYHVQCAHDSLGKAGKWSLAEDEQLRM